MASEAEKLTLLRVAESKTGYFGVVLDQRRKSKPYAAQVRRDGKQVGLGMFATAEEAALCVARSQKGQAAADAERAAPAAERAAAAASLMSEEARQQALAEGLTLRVAETQTGYFGVLHLDKPGQPRPFQANVWRGGKTVRLGYFLTAEEAALCVARSPEGRAAARRAAALTPVGCVR